MESIVVLQRTCPNCSKPVKGRRGRKFCSDYCRIDHSNRRNAKGSYSPYVRKVTNTVLKNRRVLESILTDGKTAKASKDKLIQLGFNFNYHTHLHAGNGKTYTYCYDYGYLPLENDWYLIVRQKEV